MRPADEHLRAARAVAHLDHVDLDAVALMQHLAADALRRGEHGLGIVRVGADLQKRAAGARVDLIDDAGEDLVLLGIEFFINHAALRLADALNDDLLCSLRRDAAELLGLDRDADHVADLGALADAVRRLLADLNIRVDDARDDRLLDDHLDLLFVLVENDLHIVLAVGRVLAERRQHGLTDLLIHIFARNTFFFFDICNCVKKFCVHGRIPFPYMVRCRRTCAMADF